MPPSAPERLVETVERLGLATAARVARHRSLAGRLARGAPLFDCVWLDALTRSRTLSPHQSRRIAAGQSDSLLVGPYVIVRPTRALGYATAYEARDRDTQRRVELLVARADGDANPETMRSYIEAAERIASPHLITPIGTGMHDGAVWTASPWTPGDDADRWLVHHGRMRSGSVLAIARSMVDALAMLEEEALCHGDIAARNLRLTPRGDAVLTTLGLRAAVRPSEGVTRADLPPECYEDLAPERIVRGSPPDVKSDMFACGCLWRRLLTGRPAFRGGDALRTMRAVLDGSLREASDPTILDRSLHACEAPRPLVEAIRRCLAPDANDRPASMRELAAILGPSPKRRHRFGPWMPQRFWAGQSVWGSTRSSRNTHRGSSANKGRPSTWSAAFVGLTLGAAVVAAAWMFLGKDAAPPTAEQVTTHERSPIEPPTRPATSVEQRASTSDAATAVRAAIAAPPTEAPPSPRPTAPPSIILPTDRPIDASTIRLTQPCRIGGAPAARARAVVSGEPLIVAVADVVLEHIDFISADGGDTPLVDVAAGRVTFRNCTFQGHASTAIQWRSATAPSSATFEDRVTLRDCVFRDVNTGIEIARPGRLALEARNVLHVGGGATIRLTRAASPTDSLQATLSNLTVRDTAAFLDWSTASASAADTGRVLLQADRSVFEIGQDAFLLRFESPMPLRDPLDALSWSGEDSILVGDGAAVGRLDPTGRATPLDDGRLAISGLVRGRVEFSAEPRAPGDAKILHWAAPLHSDVPPGADPTRLP